MAGEIDNNICLICQRAIHEKIDREVKRLEDVSKADLRTVCTRLDEAEKALNLAKNEMNQRLEGMNEFREELRRVQGTFVNTEKLEGTVKEVANKVELAKASAMLESKSLSERVTKIELMRASVDGKVIGMILVISIIVQVVLKFGWPK